MAIQGKQWMWMACIGGIFLVVIIVNRNFYKQYLQGEPLVNKISLLPGLRSQDDSTSQPNFCAKACRSKPVITRTYSQCGEDRGVYTKYFSDPPICNGTYLEIGALDGVRYSNTKFFEDTLGWTGVLIEAQPQNFKNLKINRPKSKTYGVAICPEGQKSVSFAGGGAVGGVVKHMSEHHKKSYIGNVAPVDVPCMSMSKLLKDAGVSHIDFFTLDVEGAELTIMETMDWSIPVRTFVIEFGHDKAKDDEVRRLLKKHGYVQPTWDIRSFCSPGGDCAPNEVWEHKDQAQFKCR